MLLMFLTQLGLILCLGKSNLAVSLSTLVKLFFSIGFSVNAISEENCTLKFVTLLYRHGDRMPIEGYANDPYKNESSW